MKGVAESRRCWFGEGWSEGEGIRASLRREPPRRRSCTPEVCEPSSATEEDTPTSGSERPHNSCQMPPPASSEEPCVLLPGVCACTLQAWLVDFQGSCFYINS